MKIQNMRSILVGIKRTLKYNLIILSEKLMLHIILQGMRYGLLYVESNSLCGGTTIEATHFYVLGSIPMKPGRSDQKFMSGVF